jgi:RimJ/RimL family protein N-acetyltransferase
MYILSSLRLGFRTWTEDDLELAMGLWGDPAVTKLIDSRPQLSAEDVKGILDRNIAFQSERGVQYWPVFLLETVEHVGCCGLRPYDADESVLEFGVHLRPLFWGQGFGEEAGRRVTRYAFETLGVKALVAGHNPHNLGSKRLLEKIGFRYTHSELYPPTGLVHPSYICER